MIFVDVICPKCGRRIGNGGSGGTFRCECGYVGDGGLSKDDKAFLEEVYCRCVARDSEAQQAAKKVAKKTEK